MADTDNEPKLISQGGYGCIYHPSFPVKTKKLNIKSSKKYVSKLQKNNYQSQFEEFIGKIIQKIPSYRYFFVPILKTYNIDLASISPVSIHKCNAITKHMKELDDQYKQTHKTTSNDNESNDNESNDNESNDNESLDYESLNNNFIIQKMEYISGSVNLKKYLYKIIRENTNTNTNTAIDDLDFDSENEEVDDVKQQENALHSGGKRLKKKRNYKQQRRQHRQLAEARHLHHQINKAISEEGSKTRKNELSYKLISILFDCYERITDCVNLLVKNEIIHNDIKYNNILINTETVTPVIIDFGLSIYIKQLLANPWRENNETGEIVHSSSPQSTLNPTKNNYYWKQHFYAHAPEYYLWPIESHIISFLIQESETLSLEALTEIAYVYTYNNEAIMYMSSEFKEKYMKLCISLYGKYINRPREEIINELIQYWDKWDIHSQNVMFLKLFCSIVIKGNSAYNDKKYYNGGKRKYQPDETATDAATATATATAATDPEIPVYFETKQLQLNTFYFLDEPKIVDIIEFMLLNIHPDPEKRMLPGEAKIRFNSILYYC
jgi:serine/threonine protein kinase